MSERLWVVMTKMMKLSSRQRCRDKQRCKDSKRRRRERLRMIRRDAWRKRRNRRLC